MYVKNILKPGQNVTLVPVGLPLTLQYNRKGILSKVYREYGEERIDSSEELVKPLMESKLVPTSISIKDGDTFVEGCLFGSKLYHQFDGPCEAVAADAILEQAQADMSALHFCAGNVYSYAASFKDLNTVRRWLKMSAFDLLPAFLVPVIFNEDTMYNLLIGQLKTCCKELREFLTANTPLISRYMRYTAGDAEYISTNIRQYEIQEIHTYTDKYGAVMCHVLGVDLDHRIPYSTAAHFHMGEGVIIVLDDSNKVVYSFNVDKRASHQYKPNLHCEWCGRIYKPGAYGEETICSDEHCLSRQFTSVSHMLSRLGLPEIEFDEYRNLCMDKKILWIPDVLDLPQYKDAEICASLYEMIDAVIPVLCVPDRESIQSFVNACSNLKSSVQFYINHPDKICPDLALPPFKMTKLVRWLSDEQNAKLLETFLFSDRFHITESGLKFEGDPIFRSNTIMITGKFVHGSLEDISNILRAYSATVVLEYNDSVQCVVVGDTKEDIDGAAIRQAHWDHKPVVDESEFFRRYEIDQDLEAHGLS